MWTVSGQIFMFVIEGLAGLLIGVGSGMGHEGPEYQEYPGIKS